MKANTAANIVVPIDSNNKLKAEIELRRFFNMIKEEHTPPIMKSFLDFYHRSNRLGRFHYIIATKLWAIGEYGSKQWIQQFNEVEKKVLARTVGMDVYAALYRKKFPGYKSLEERNRMECELNRNLLLATKARQGDSPINQHRGISRFR